MFASCSVDKTVKIWDTRKRGGAALSVQAHTTDVNVISWNRITPHLMVSGADDGTFSVWDLRNFQSYVFFFGKQPIATGVLVAAQPPIPF